MRTIIDILRKPFPDANTVEILTFYGGLFAVLVGLLRWFYKRHIIKHPFKMMFPDKWPASSVKVHNKKEIKGINGLFDEETFVLGIKIRTDRHLEQINLRLLNKKWSRIPLIFWRWDNVPIEVVFIERIRDLLGERVFDDKDDSVGGRDGYYSPSYYCPKGDYLWYSLKLKINLQIKEWKGYISFQHRRGDANRAYVRRKLNIKNINLEE